MVFSGPYLTAGRGTTSSWPCPPGKENAHELRIVALAVIFPSLAGCEAVVMSTVRPQASFDHRCPEDRIQIVRHDSMWKNVEVNVCGTPRRYQCVGGSIHTPCTWVEEAGTASRQ
jgi:hypothetical protein